MKHSKLIYAMVAMALCALCCITVSAQQSGSWAGKYEGTAKAPNSEIALKLDLTEEAGKYSGQITSPNGVYKIVSAQMADGVLTLEAEGNGAKGKMVLRQKGDMLAGDFITGENKGAVEFKKVTAVDEISGEWDAVADAQGQAFPFTLILKLDGEKVTGSSSSQLGTSNVSTGTWKDGKLAVLLDSGTGQIALIGTMIDGKLSGDYDYAGQLQGKWVAIRKK